MDDANVTATARPASAGRDHQRTPSLRRKAASENMSSLRVVNVSPQADRQTVRGIWEEDHDMLHLDSPTFTPPIHNDAAFASPSPQEPMSPVASPAPPSVFDIAEEPQDERYTEPTTVLGSGHELDEPESYNLKPPPPALAQNNIESLATRFFSVHHLDEILRDPGLALRFTQFLTKYHPTHSQTLRQYTEARKAVAAVEFANAIASQLQPPPGSPLGQPPFVAAVLDDRFEANTRRINEDLIEEVLPAYLTHRLVSLITDTLVKEITGNSSPIMHDLVPSLAEIFCITDPSMPDNPIVYASEEFYNISQHGREFVIGRNCRFLQGPKTSASSVRRLIEALARGEEVCETLLNYRRDGSSFMNLLMIAPLYDNKGVVRYFLGCQIDVSSLLEGGRGLESFARLLAKEKPEGICSGHIARDPKQVLADFGQMLTEGEADVVRNQPRRMSFGTQPPGSIRSSSVVRPVNRSRNSRIVLSMDEVAGGSALWPNASLVPSRRFPGVYQNYLLVRPYPSLRITFTSPALRIPGLLQTKLLDRIGGPSTIREGLLDALSRGTSVTAKVTWLPAGSNMGDGKLRWLHCTPLFGSDDRVGVWMVVIVEKEEVTGSLNATYGNGSRASLVRPIGADQFSTNKLYSDYLKRDGRSWTSYTQRTMSSIRERREADEHFRDF